MVQCPSCARPQEPRFLCERCGTPLGIELDYFTALGLAPKLTLDLRSLQETYHNLGRRIHPDRFATAAGRIRDASLRATALLTKSYRTLRDPASRGLYWLHLHGERLGENNKQVPPELAETVFEVQEQLAALRASARSDKGAELREHVRARRAEVAGAMEELLRELERNFARWDARGLAPRTPSLSRPTDAGLYADARGEDTKDLIAELKAILSRIAYLRTLLRDVDRELENSKAT